MKKAHTKQIKIEEKNKQKRENQNQKTKKKTSISTQKTHILQGTETGSDVMAKQS